MVLRERNSGAKSGRELFSGAKSGTERLQDSATLVVCTQ